MHPKVAARVLREAARFNCSASYVMATALEVFFNVKIQDRYYD